MVIQTRESPDDYEPPRKVTTQEEQYPFLEWLNVASNYIEPKDFNSGDNKIFNPKRNAWIICIGIFVREKIYEISSMSLDRESLVDSPDEITADSYDNYEPDPEEIIPLAYEFIPDLMRNKVKITHTVEDKITIDGYEICTSNISYECDGPIYEPLARYAYALAKNRLGVLRAQKIFNQMAEPRRRILLATRASIHEVRVFGEEFQAGEV